LETKKLILKKIFMGYAQKNNSEYNEGKMIELMESRSDDNIEK
jgi:hypothetical protein